MAEKQKSVENQGELKKVLSLPYLIFLALGGIFGTGIFSMSASMIGLIGDAVWIPMVVTFFMALFDAFIYTEFGLTYPSMSTTFVYIKEGFGGKVGEAISWINSISMLFAGMLSSAMLAASTGSYVISTVKLFLGVDLDPIWIVAAMMLFAYVLNYLGVTPAILVGDAMAAAQLLVVFFLIILGIAFPTRAPDYFNSFSIGNFAMALSMARFAYGGYATPITYIEETKEPLKTIPKAVIGSVIITVIGYVGAVIAMVRMSPPSVIAFAPNPFVVATSSVLGGVATYFFALFGTIASLKGTILGMGGRARFLAGMSREGFLPKPLGKISKRGIPSISLTLYFVILLIGNFFGGYMGSFVWLVRASSVVGCITLLFVPIANILHHVRKETRDMKRPWKQPFVLGKIPLCAIAVIIYALFILSNVQLSDLIPTIVSYVIGTILYVVWLLRREASTKKVNQ